MSERDRIVEALTDVAWKESQPFCYGCYQIVPDGVCPGCGTDDLMRYVSGIGVEWGIEWVVKHLTSENLKPIRLDEAFESHVEDCYEGEVTIGWITSDVGTAIKNLDPVAWRIAKGEWVDAELEDGTMISFDGGDTCYWAHDIEEFCRSH